MTSSSNCSGVCDTAGGAGPRSKAEKEFDLAKWLVSGTAAACLNYYRSAPLVVFVGGAIANSVAAKVLKRVINQPRPSGSEGQGLPDPGMPSSHAHMLFFLTAYAAHLEWGAGSAARGGALSSVLGGDSGALMSLAAPALALTVAVGSCAHRVRTGKHTMAQVCVGAATGAAGGLAWRWACGGDVATASVARRLAALRSSGAWAWAEWPLLLGVQAVGLFWLTGGGRSMSMRRSKRA